MQTPNIYALSHMYEVKYKSNQLTLTKGGVYEVNTGLVGTLYINLKGISCKS